MLGGTGGRRRRGRQRMRWLDGIADLMDVSLSDGQGGLVCCNSWSCKESDKTEPLNWTEDVYRFMTMLCKQLILFYVLYISICLPSLSFSVILYPSIYLFLFVDSSPHSALHFFPSSLKNLFYWSIVDLQRCLDFCYIAKWFNYAYIHSFP